ncbi:unnamed protein product [Zymoseptoria tritici ST99CH_1E4]|uniref:Uncharacterized protein n=1 Tax=Zymoseptoria tritici ST99CH_1E4 TaxID=1276532 RepID=A0A2H1GQ81_ZYMTR|nr:unnamed protein product [Zymoseptoria tritici ST99CH_1E4]
MESIQANALQQEPPKTSTALSAPMTDIWTKLPQEMKDKIIVQAAITPLKVHLYTTGPYQHDLQAIHIEAWQTVKNALSVTQSSRKAALKILHESGSIEDVDITLDEHDCYRFGAWTRHRPSNALLSHFNLLWRWMPFYTPNVSNYPDVMAHWKERDPVHENARIKFYVPFPHPGQARAVARIEIHASSNPVTAWGDGEVKAMVFEWVLFVSTTSWAFSDNHGTLPFPMEGTELRALICWVEA